MKQKGGLEMNAVLKKFFRSSRGERGAVLMLTALALPMIFALTGLTIDIGNAYLAKSSLQNAADAAALAGGHTYADTNRQISPTENTVLNYSGKNLAGDTIQQVGSKNSRPTEDDTVYVYPDIQKDTVDVYLSKRVPMIFLGAAGKLLGIDSLTSMNVSVASRARLTKGGSGSGYFDYTLFGAATKTKDGNSLQPANNPEEAALVFKGNPHNPYKIAGNIGSNGRIGLNNNNGGEYNFQMNGASGINDDGISRVDTSSLYGTDNLFANPQGTAKGPTNSKYNTNVNDPPMDISFSATNPVTSDLYAFYQKVKNLSETNLEAAEQKGWYCDDTTPATEKYKFDAGGLTYYNGNLRWGQDLNPLGVQCNSNNIYKHSANMTADKERFRVIIVNGDIELNMEKTTTDNKLHAWDMNEQYQDVDGDGQTHDNYAVIISLHGNIHMHNYSKFRGIIYAPEGTIWLDSYDRIYANVVGQRVKVDNQDYDVESGPFLTKRNASNPELPHFNSSSKVSVTLESI